MSTTDAENERTSGSQKDRVTATFSAEGNTLALRSMYANVSIGTGVGIKSVRAAVTGNASAMKALKVNTIDGLELTGRPIGLTGKIAILTVLWLIAGLFIGFKRARVRIERILRGSPYRLTITVPEGTNIFVREFRGKITGEGRLGQFEGVLHYGSNVTLESLTTLNLNATVDCTVKVYSLKGNCWTVLHNNCELEIQDGEIRFCDLQLGTDCVANIAASCVDTDVKTGESCEVSLGTCTGYVNLRLGPRSELVVVGGHLEKLYGKTDAQCMIIAEGVIDLVSLDMSLGNSLVLGEVVKMLRADCRAGCTVVTKRGAGVGYVDINLGMGGNMTLVGVIRGGQIQTAVGVTLKVGALRDVATKFEYDTVVTEGHYARGI